MAMKFYSEAEAVDKVIGTKGTPERMEFDAQVEDFLIGEAIRQARQTKQLTQEQLGDLIGVGKAQISKIENGGNITLRTITRIFRAMGVKASLDMGAMGRVALC